MSLLPENVDAERYWRDIYSQPLPFWKAALAHVTTLHDCAADAWVRAALGRNVVFLSATTVVKFGPPCWAGDVAREAAALHYVATRLPIATPTTVAAGTIGAWEYQIQKRLPGTNLHEVWNQLSHEQRTDLAYQHGELMAAIHALSIDAAPSELRFDWAHMLAEQRSSCAATMQASGVDPALAAQVEEYLASVMPLLVDDRDHVLLHGDLTHLNFLVAQQKGRWEITGLIDWGDVKIGPRTHELISPGVHMYRGDRPALEQWYRGYGWVSGERNALQEHLIMARTMLYYADEFAALLRVVPGASTRKDWPSIAQQFWHLIR